MAFGESWHRALWELCAGDAKKLQYAREHKFHHAITTAQLPPSLTEFNFFTASLHLSLLHLLFLQLLNISLTGYPQLHLTRHFSHNHILSSPMAGSSSTPDPWLNPFPTGKGWVAMLFGSARGDQDLFLDYMKIATRYNSADVLVDAADLVQKKATPQEKKCMQQSYGNKGKGILPIDTLLWAMREAESSDDGQRKQWEAHRYVAPTQAATDVAVQEEDDDDDLQIVAPPAEQARRRPPPIIVIDEDDEEEEVQKQTDPRQIKQIMRRSARLANPKDEQ
ncbi:hypothetical protein TRIUR3_11049 [Triticum urartu]|uniref:Uncharacterized protein n=1 Tax=Triticum urartu TaxID=4572 RepID=M7ZM66_TRIUA|nr:hypothetical protein TRIUR3_11049 [Triticum urartu]